MMSHPLVFLDFSDRRHVFTCGDVHGRFDLLECHLHNQAFDPAQDCLIMLGDLVDRGPLSHKAIDWLQRPSIFSVRGNHEEILIRAQGEIDTNRLMINRNGGAWFLDLHPEEAAQTIDLFGALPIAIEAKLPSGKHVGFVHADVPQGDWHSLSHKRQIFAGENLDHAIWDRTLFRLVQTRLNFEANLDDIPDVAGIDHVFHGHSIVGDITNIGNRTWLDLGAYRTDQLALIDVELHLSLLAALGDTQLSPTLAA